MHWVFHIAAEEAVVTVVAVVETAITGAVVETLPLVVAARMSITHCRNKCQAGVHLVRLCRF